MKYSVHSCIALVAVGWLFADAGCMLAQESITYRASTVYTMTGDPISPGEVVVKDGKIEAVRPAAGDKNDQTVDLGDGSVIMPGLINAYSQTALDATSADEITSEVTLGYHAAQSIDWSKTALRHALDEGTTTMNVCPGTENVLGGTAAIIKTDPTQRRVVQPDGAMVAAMCNDPASGNSSRARPDSIFVRQPTNRMGVVWILRNTMHKAGQESAAADLASLHQALQGDRPLFVVSRLSFDLTTVGTLADEFGFSPVIVGGQEAYKVKQDLAKRKYPVILQPLATGSIRGPEGSEVCWNQAGVLHEAGITVALSGDSLLDQARFAYRNGLPKDVALAAITSTPARLLAMDKQVGSIAPGLDADLIALTGEPLELTTSIRWVMVNGNKLDITKDQ